ncbi:MAG: ankyrin repeat domain-containing protein [Elusimicrobiota bacterium]
MSARGLIIFLLVCGPASAAPTDACRGLARAVSANDPDRLKTILDGGCRPATPARGINPLLLAVAPAHVEVVRLLLDAGADPNAVDGRGVAVVHWLGSRPGAADDDVLEVAKLLELHHCDFKEGKVPPEMNVVTNLAPRRMPKTLAFLASRKIGSGYDRALRSLSKTDDLESTRALLDAGADPIADTGPGTALSFAAAAGRAPAVAVMLKHVKDMTDAKVVAAYRLAVRAGRSDAAQAFVDAGLKPPPVEAPVRPLCPPAELTPEQGRLMERLGVPNTNGLAGLAGGINCKLIQQCGDYLLVDCNSAADGPAYYIDQRAPKILATCGGACMAGCKNCPPKEWTCSCAR